ncbi:hypothetical protein ACOJVU_09830, partial [Mycobacterium sp. THU-M104]|uniref:hypothetical protein n=1 Tax=Mycobacterium sp. THU-M104 TaxID=3410515 RepID=UPI003B9BD309
PLANIFLFWYQKSIHESTDHLDVLGMGVMSMTCHSIRDSLLPEMDSPVDLPGVNRDGAGPAPRVTGSA